MYISLLYKYINVNKQITPTINIKSISSEETVNILPNKKELTLAAQRMGQTEFKPLTPAESKAELEKVGMLFGGNVEIIKMAIALSREFAARKNYHTAIYFMQVAYNLTHDDNLKNSLEELVKLAKTN